MTGWIKTFLGKVRPIVVLISVLAFLFFPSFLTYSLLGSLGVLSLLSIAQILSRRQPRPVWTSKALAVCGGAFAFDVALCILCWQFSFLLPLIPLLQPLTVGLAIVFFLPVDKILKQRVMAKASAMRAADGKRTVIGIVGSVGKTTTKELIRHLLQDLSPVVTPQHVNTEMGVAQWLLRELPKANTESPLVVEMGAYRRGEVSTLCAVAQPTIGVVTALGSDHLALFGSEEAIIAANGELLAALPSAAPAFCAIDTESGRLLVAGSPRPVTTVGLSRDAQIHAENVQDAEDGLHLRNNDTDFVVPLRGVHHAVNVLLAIAVARQMGVAEARIKHLLLSFEPLKNTFNVRQERGIVLVDDTYNASRLSMRAALDWAAMQPQRPRMLLASGLLELGDDEDKIMEEMGRYAAGNIEIVVFLSEHGAKAFERGSGLHVESFTPSIKPVPPGGLLLCVGRMPPSAISALLP